MWEDNDPEVQEIAGEQGRQYTAGSWRGWTDKLGRWNARMHCPAHEQDRLNELVMERKLQKQRQEAEEARRRAEEAEEAPEEPPAAEGRRPRSPFSRVSLPHHVAGLWGSVLGAGAGLAGVGMGLALTPLGATGAGVAQVGRALVNLLASSLRMVGTVGAGLLTVALGTVLAGAIGASAAMVLSAVSNLFGQIAETITSALQGVAGVVRDVFREAADYVRSVMQMVYVGGQTPAEAAGAAGALGAFGLRPQETAGLLGQWMMRPEFLAPRLAPLGGLRYGADGEIDWEATLRGMRQGLQAYPEMAQYPVLQGLMGQQGARMLMPIMQMEQPAFERALATAGELRPELANVRALREELMPLQAQVGMLASVLKVELASAALEPVLALLRAMVDLVRENRDVINEWLRTLPGRLAEWMAEAAEKADELLTSLPHIARSLSEIADHLRALWDWLQRIGDFMSAHPTLSAVMRRLRLPMVGAAIGGLRGGPAGALVGGLMGAGAELGGAAFGGWGTVGGGALGLVSGTALLRHMAARAAAETAAGTAAGTAAAGGGLAAAGLGSVVAMIAGILVASTTIAAWTSGWWDAYRQQKAAEGQYRELEAGARELGYVTPEMAAESFGPEIARRFRLDELTPREQELVGERYYEMIHARGEREGQPWTERAHDVLQKIEDRMHEVAEHTSPDQVRHAVQRGQEEATRRQETTFTFIVRPSTEFELELERQEALRAWRAIQLVVG